MNVFHDIVCFNACSTEHNVLFAADEGKLTLTTNS